MSIGDLLVQGMRELRTRDPADRTPMPNPGPTNRPWRRKSGSWGSRAPT